jgi:cell fate (sporulation/competence/biofilm development) regulator YlbF (YheA/YmcA/DUF963 family)
VEWIVQTGKGVVRQMAVNLHDSAYELEKAIRQSDEYTNLRKIYDEVNADESARTMFENFRNIQMELQQKQMSGQEISQEEVEQAQKTVALVQQHATISKLMEAEQRMSMAITELNQIIMKPLEELYGSMENN